MKSVYQDLKESVYEANMELHKSGLVIHTFGNVSGYDENKDVMAIKPSGVPYEKLTVDDIIIVDLENNIVEGKLKPSSDTKTHTLLYKNFNDIRGVAHTHSTYAVAWSQAMMSVPILGTTHADSLNVDIPCTNIMSDEMINGDYETSTGKQILEAFKDLSYKEIEMVLVACHGPFTWADSPRKAVLNSVILEELSKMASLTLQLNPNIESLKQTLINKHYQRKHGKDAYYGQ